uniref:Uncharacterized protein n=1 Tax=Tanacetum cinerariifolium TaxID=118510 RepID=A0A699H2B7_TANCI|nr:hypothetical protein [Tanacetum cinerariifolium]
MADLTFPDRLAASLDHAPVLPDHLPRAPEPEPDMDIDEEDPEEDQVMDFEVDDKVEEWEDDEDRLIAPVTPPTVAAPVV